MEAESLVQRVEAVKELGVKAFGQKEYESALKYFSEGIEEVARHRPELWEKQNASGTVAPRGIAAHTEMEDEQHDSDSDDENFLADMRRGLKKKTEQGSGHDTVGSNVIDSEGGLINSVLKRELAPLLYSLYNNAAFCNIQLKNWAQARACCETCLRYFGDVLGVKERGKLIYRKCTAIFYDRQLQQEDSEKETILAGLHSSALQLKNELKLESEANHMLGLHFKLSCRPRSDALLALARNQGFEVTDEEFTRGGERGKVNSNHSAASLQAENENNASIVDKNAAIIALDDRTEQIFGSENAICTDSDYFRSENYDESHEQRNKLMQKVKERCAEAADEVQGKATQNGAPKWEDTEGTICITDFRARMLKIKEEVLVDEDWKAGQKLTTSPRGIGQCLQVAVSDDEDDEGDDVPSVPNAEDSAEGGEGTKDDPKYKALLEYAKRSKVKAEIMNQFRKQGLTE